MLAIARFSIPKQALNEISLYSFFLFLRYRHQDEQNCIPDILHACILRAVKAPGLLRRRNGKTFAFGFLSNNRLTFTPETIPQSRGKRLSLPQRTNAPFFFTLDRYWKYFQMLNLESVYEKFFFKISFFPGHFVLSRMWLSIVIFKNFPMLILLLIFIFSRAPSTAYTR